MNDRQGKPRAVPGICAGSLMHVKKWGLWANFLLLTVLSIVFWACAKQLKNPDAWQKVINGLSSFELLLGIGLVDVLVVGVALLLVPYVNPKSLYRRASKPLELLANAAVAYIALALVSGVFRCRLDGSVAAAMAVAALILLFCLAGAGLLRHAASLQWHVSGKVALDLVIYLGIALSALGFTVWAFSYPIIVETVPAGVERLRKLPFLLDFRCPWG
ncbi:hypothetical protein [Stenotrophomonas maltophilia]|uniref:hypothetical protein n=1 Tax=Stenotrophomonas maltophilia TaxID=40324 RepID=UPI0034DB126E